MLVEGKAIRLHPLTCTAFNADFDGDGDIDIYFLNGAPLQGTKADSIPTNRLYRNLGDFRFADVTAFDDPDFLPGGAKYGDIDSLLQLAENGPWRVDEKGLPGWLR